MVRVHPQLIFESVIMADVKEEPYPVQHYLRATPVNNPFTDIQGHRLPKKKNQQYQIIDRMGLNDYSEVCEDGEDGSASTSLTPIFTPKLNDLSNERSTSASGFSTPDFANKHKPPFALVEEPLLNQDAYMAQELIDWEFLQQIARELEYISENRELEGQFQTQIKTEEESSNQAQDAIPPFQQQSHIQTLNQPLPQMNIESDSANNLGLVPPMQAVSPSFLSNNALHSATQPQLSPSNASGSSSKLICANCSRERKPDDIICWKCFRPLPLITTSLENLNIYPALNPLQIQEMQYTQNVKAQEEALAQQHHLQLQQPQSQTQRLPPMSALLHSTSPMKPPQPFQPPLPLPPAAFREAQVQTVGRPEQVLRQLQLQQAAQTLFNYTPGVGNSYSLVTLNNSLSAPQPLQTNTFIPNVTQPPATPLLHNRFSVPNKNAVARITGPVPGPISHLSSYPQHSYNAGASSAKDIKDLLTNIRPDEDIKVEDEDAIIPGLAQDLRLMKHQQATLSRKGLKWMQEMEESKKRGGLLADEMGLGKTIQSIALLVTRRSNDINRKTTLICTPVALLRQWFNEIQTKSDPPLSVCIQHSINRCGKAKSSEDLLKYDVVLTTYNTISLEWKAFEKWKNTEEELRGEKPKNLFLDTKWYRIILDEAQVIKNRKTQTARGVTFLHAKYRWSLSGTPMQNGVDEIYSQLAFLRIQPYDDWKAFQATFVLPLKSSYQRRNAMVKFQALLKAILLRRTKKSKIDGVEILKELPEKNIDMSKAEFKEKQQEFYRDLAVVARDKMKMYQAEGTLKRNYGNALVMLLRLRQACLHPLLTKKIKKAGSLELTAEEQIASAREFSEQTVFKIKEIIAFTCLDCHEAVINPSLVVPCGHYYCPDCLAVAFDQEREDTFARGDDGVKAKCPECKGDMDPKRLVSLESFKAAHCPDEEKDTMYISNEDASEADDDDEWVLVEGRKRKRQDKEHMKIPCRNVKPDIEGKMGALVSSAKIEKLCEILETIRTRDPSEKVIVFSQFIGFFDFIQPALEARNFRFGRYDGGMTARRREEELERFRSDPLRSVFLVSLRAGAYGLNLTCASQCVILDPFWNPFVEAQAIDRIHRIGQKRPVQVHRVVIEGTVEDRILALQEKKRGIIEGALSEDASKAISRLQERELLFLFGIDT